jgi:uncharacterized protein YndB with AHSA1/START domain
MAASENNLVITRVFDAPLELVWKAWTEPEEVMRWWGPKIFTSPLAEIDLRVGGKYHFCMRTPEGQDIHSGGTYREIIPMEKIVCTDSFADEKGNVVSPTQYGMGPDFPLELLITVEFEEFDGKTRMNLTHVGIPQGEMLDMTHSGWNESFDKLEESLKVKEGK